MSKEEFLNELRIALQGEVSQNAINENIEYYNRYIMGEVRKGRTQESVMEELGNPRLIARTIIDTQANMENSGNMYNSDKTSYAQEEYTDDYGQERKKGFHGEFANNGGWDIRFGNLKLNTWYGKLIIFICVVFFIVIFGVLLNVLFPFILFGVGIWLLITLLNRRY